MKTTEEVRELGKKEVAYDRQVAICGKKEADGVLYFWMKGYEFAKGDEFLSLAFSHVEFTQSTFREATWIASLAKLEGEANEVQEAILREFDQDKVAEEYADCLMCLFDSASRVGISPEDIKEAFAKKLKINATRTWVKNSDNTYSHVKK